MGVPMKRVLALIMSLLALCLVAGCSNPLQEDKVTVQAAASLQNAMTEIADKFKAQHNLKDDQLVLNFAGSGTLRQQIEQGAPANIFVSADEKNMQMLADKGLVSDVTPLVTNELVMVTPTGHEPITIHDLIKARGIVIGNPETVPAGHYAQEALEKANLWVYMAPSLIYAKDVRAVLAYVEKGAADVGFVYKTDALVAGDKVSIAEVLPADSHDPIIYPIGVVSKNDSKLTREFYEYLLSDEAQAILAQYGFTPAVQK